MEGARAREKATRRAAPSLVPDSVVEGSWQEAQGLRTLGYRGDIRKVFRRTSCFQPYSKLVLPRRYNEIWERLAIFRSKDVDNPFLMTISAQVRNLVPASRQLIQVPYNCPNVDSNHFELRRLGYKRHTAHVQSCPVNNCSLRLL